MKAEAAPSSAGWAYALAAAGAAALAFVVLAAAPAAVFDPEVQARWTDALARPAPDAPRVLLITLDGVRWQEVFDASGRIRPAGAEQNERLMPFFHKTFARGVLAGHKSRGSRVRTSSAVPLSLPGYKAILAGYRTSCRDNKCTKRHETVLDRIQRRLRLPTEDVAVFASWSKMRYAISGRKKPRFHHDIPADKPDLAQPPPWDHARWDRETHAAAATYLRQHQPRLMMVSYLDADEWAHQRNEQAYVQSLAAFDARLRELFSVLDELGLTASTTVIITTDHGRGNGKRYHGHGRYRAAQNIFLAAVGPQIPALGRVRGGQHRRIRQSDIRPTIEWALGLTPSECPHKSCGRPLPTAFGVDPWAEAVATAPGR